MSNGRFKFRVWDSLINEYRKEGTIQLSGNGQPFIIDGNMQPQDIDKVIIEQCTGLTDKNGKLIYEGDIIMFAGVKMIVEWSVGSCRWVLRYADKKHSLYGETMSMSSPNKEFFGNEYIIFGNIHDKENDK